MIRKTIVSFIALNAILFGFAVCSPSGDEPVQVEFPVTADGGGIAVCTTALRWEVTVTDFVVAIKNLEFTIEGETHASLLRRISDVIVPSALAHPGHYAGGDVTGELAGEWVIDFVNGTTLVPGTAVLLEGDYNGMNLWFATATAAGSPADHPVIGHTAYIAGTATDGTSTVPFEAFIDMEGEVRMVGGVFELVVDEDTEASLVLQVQTIDPFENDTLFEDIDFAALPVNGDGVAQMAAGDAAHNILMRTLVRHDHWAVVAL